MPRVRIMTSISTTEASYKRGQEVDLDEATARSWVEAGMAVPTGSREPNQAEKQDSPVQKSTEQKEASADEDEQTVPETTARRTGRPAARKPKGR